MNDSSRREVGAEDGQGCYPGGGAWRKSSFSMSAGDCVEVTVLTDAHVGVRDSKASAGPHLRFPQGAWATFLGDVRIVHAKSGDLIQE